PGKPPKGKKRNGQQGQPSKQGQAKLSPQQVQYLKQAGACFKCYNQGHTAKYWPLNRPVPVAATSAAMPMNPFYQAYPAMPMMPMYLHMAPKNHIQLQAINTATMTDQHQENREDQ